jgi:hypothetical protein
MSKSKIAFIAALAGMSIASPAFAQSPDIYGNVRPYHYEGETLVWGSWYGHEQDRAGNRRREGTRRSPRDAENWQHWGWQELAVPLAYDVHPDFGYFCAGPRVRRDLRVALVSMLFGIAIGAAIVTIRAAQASETDGVSSNARLKSSGTDTWALLPTGPNLQFKNADAAAEPVEAIKPFPMRMMRVRPSKPASSIAAIPLGHTGPLEPDSIRDSGVAQERREPRSPRGVDDRWRRLHRNLMDTSVISTLAALTGAAIAAFQIVSRYR